MENEEFERICFNCNNWFPSTNDPTTFGICLNDPAFEPYLDELLEKNNYSCCKKLIEQKKIDGSKEACADFSLAEFGEEIEIDDDSEFGKELHRGIEQGHIDKEALEKAAMIDYINKTDWKSQPVTDIEPKLKSSKAAERNSAINTLMFLVSYDNEAAWHLLLSYFKEQPVPATLAEVHSRIDLLERIRFSKFKSQLIPVFIDELYRTPSNNTTRQWISAIFKELRYAPLELIEAPLKKMLSDKRFSYRLKEKIRTILDEHYDR